MQLDKWQYFLFPSTKHNHHAQRGEQPTVQVLRFAQDDNSKRFSLRKENGFSMINSHTFPSPHQTQPLSIVILKADPLGGECQPAGDHPDMTGSWDHTFRVCVDVTAGRQACSESRPHVFHQWLSTEHPTGNSFPADVTDACRPIRTLPSQWRCMLSAGGFSGAVLPV